MPLPVAATVFVSQLATAIYPANYWPIISRTIQIVSMDTLSPVIEQLALSANTFFTGTLCSDTTFSDPSGPGHLHLLRDGELTLHVDGSIPVLIKQPSVVLFAPPLSHRLEASETPGAELVCAEISLDSGNAQLLPFGMPNPLIVPLADARGLEATLELLFDEALDNRLGARAAIDRLMELLFVLLLRHYCDSGELQPGLLAGLAHPQLSKALMAMHEDLGQQWNLDHLATTAAMSRARFASAFKEHVGVPPGEYLTTLRVLKTQTELKLGRPLKSIAASVGYADATALARVFKQHTGRTPRAWLAENKVRAEDDARG
jgi:AraC-like DNA-binding protein